MGENPAGILTRETHVWRVSNVVDLDTTTKNVFDGEKRTKGGSVVGSV